MSATWCELQCVTSPCCLCVLQYVLKCYNMFDTICYINIWCEQQYVTSAPADKISISHHFSSLFTMRLSSHHIPTHFSSSRVQWGPPLIRSLRISSKEIAPTSFRFRIFSMNVIIDHHDHHQDGQENPRKRAVDQVGGCCVDQLCITMTFASQSLASSLPFVFVFVFVFVIVNHCILQLLSLKRWQPWKVWNLKASKSWNSLSRDAVGGSSALITMLCTPAPQNPKTPKPQNPRRRI